MLRIGLLVAVVVLIAAAFAALRPGVEATSRVDGDVTIACAASAMGEVEPCRIWGDDLVAAGPPSTTFEAEDVVELRIDRAWFGLGETCTARWFLGRYPDDPAWTEEVVCR